LVLKVAFPPPGVQSKRSGSDELVRHFLIEPTLEGVRLKGCANEPVFSSLSDLVYQHSMTALALPCRLIIPDSVSLHLQTCCGVLDDLILSSQDLFYSPSYLSPAQLQLMTQGAACNVLYLYSVDTESLTGPEAVRKAVHTLFAQRPLPKIGVQVVHFKASQQGITLTDNLRRSFFRKHYPARSVSYCGMDPDDHRWSMQMPSDEITS
jgi:tensin